MVHDPLSLSYTKNTLLFITFSFFTIPHPPTLLFIFLSSTTSYSSSIPTPSSLLSSSYSSTHCYLHPSIIPPNSVLPTHILIYSSPITLISIIRLLSLSSTFLAIYLIFVIFDQLVFPCPPERCHLQKYTTFHHFFTLTYPLPSTITLYLPFFYYLLFLTSFPTPSPLLSSSYPFYSSLSSPLNYSLKFSSLHSHPLLLLSHHSH